MGRGEEGRREAGEGEAGRKGGEGRKAYLDNIPCGSRDGGNDGSRASSEDVELRDRRRVRKGRRKQWRGREFVRVM